MSKALIKSTAVVSSMTLCSRLFGFARDVVFAQLLGPALGLDAFIVAFRVPNFMRRLFAEGAFSQAFVPVLADYRQTADDSAVREFISYLGGSLLTILLLVTALGMLLAPLLVALFAPGFLSDPGRFALTTTLLRITFPYLTFISLIAFAAGILNSYDIFSIPALTPVLLNLVLILAAGVGVTYFSHPMLVLAWAVPIAGAVQLFFQVPFLHRIGMLTRFRVNFHAPGVRRVLKRMCACVFAVSIAQISLFIDTLFASFLPHGSISWLYFADRLMNFPLGVFAVATTTVIMPKLSRQHAANSDHAFSQTLDWGMRFLLLLGLPAAAGLLFLSQPLLVTLFQYGRFSRFDMLMTSRALNALACGVPAFMLTKTLVVSFYSKHNVKVPLKIAGIILLINLVLNALLVVPLAHAGLALATSLAAWCNVGLLLWYIRRDNLCHFQPGWGKFIAQLLLAVTVMVCWLLWASPDINRWVSWHWPTRLWHLLGLIVVAKLLYFGTLAMVGVRKQHFL